MNEWHNELPRSPAAPAIARASLVAWCGSELEDDQLETAKLLVSELVTNAVVHGEGRIALWARIDEDRVLVDVADEGGGFEYDMRHRGFEDVAGGGGGWPSSMQDRAGGESTMARHTSGSISSGLDPASGRARRADS